MLFYVFFFVCLVVKKCRLLDQEQKAYNIACKEKQQDKEDMDEWKNEMDQMFCILQDQVIQSSKIEDLPKVAKTNNIAQLLMVTGWGKDEDDDAGETKKALLYCQVVDKTQPWTLPQKGSQGAAGYDIASSVAQVIPPHTCKLVPTNLIIATPKGTYGRLAPRSGLACASISVDAGVVDGDYRGHVKVLLLNRTNQDFKVNIGDRIAQLILEKIQDADVVFTETLSTTARGAQGFGSTGVTQPLGVVAQPIGVAQPIVAPPKVAQPTSSSSSTTASTTSTSSYQDGAEGEADHLIL